MTRKLAVVGLPCGGGKAVIAIPEVPTGDERRRLFERYADLIDALGGTYVTGPDMNTGEADMDVIGARTPHVFCRSTGNGGSGDPSIHTALGVFHGIRSSLAHALGSDELAGRTVLVQGTARSARSSRGYCSTLERSSSSATSTRIGRARPGQPHSRRRSARARVRCLRAVRARSDAERQVDPSLRCRIVAGAANNQLATAEDGERLRTAGILYAPDYVINSGGALHGIGLERLGWTPDELERKVEGIGETLSSIYRQAETAGITTSEAAERLAAERLTQS